MFHLRLQYQGAGAAGAQQFDNLNAFGEGQQGMMLRMKRLYFFSPSVTANCVATSYLSHFIMYIDFVLLVQLMYLHQYYIPWHDIQSQQSQSCRSG